MKAKTSRLRQQLWRAYQASGRTLRATAPDQPMTPGFFYLMRRKCGKAPCRCARGQLHPAWVLTRSEAGRHKFYSVPADQRAQVRQRTAAWPPARDKALKKIQALEENLLTLPPNPRPS